jgi:O-methyltransferase
VESYRVFELWSLVGEACKLPGKGALLEVGVWRGGTSGVIARKMELCGSGDILYAADTFTGVVKSSEKDATYNDGDHADTDLDLVKKLLYKDLGLSNVELLQGIFPDDTAKFIPQDTRFRFCHIDVDVYNSAEGILDWVWERMLVGGIVVFDDYGFITCNGITRFVNEQRSRKDRLFIYNLNGHAILIKLF